MDIYSKTNNNYRKIWIKHFGPIPKDVNGVSYEIHHIDGNHSNNSIDNLQLVTIEEHFNIHYNRGDIGSANMIAKRMHYGLTKKQLSEIAKLNVLEQIKTGKHNFSNKELHAAYIRKSFENGNHPTQNSTLQSIKGKKGAVATRPKRIMRFISDNPNKKMKTCEHCGVTTTAPVYGRKHGKKCKSLIHSDISNLSP